MLTAMMMTSAVLSIVECKPCFQEGSDCDNLILGQSSPLSSTVSPLTNNDILSHNEDQGDLDQWEVNVEHREVNVERRHVVEDIDYGVEDINETALDTTESTTRRTTTVDSREAIEIEVSKQAIELQDLVDRDDPAMQLLPEMMVNTDNEITVLEAPEENSVS